MLGAGACSRVPRGAVFTPRRGGLGLMIYRSMLDNFFSTQRPLYSMGGCVWTPPTDIYESEKSTIIKMEVAGLDEDKFQLSVRRNLLVVSGRRQPDQSACKLNYHLIEVHYGPFERVFAFSHNLRESDIAATYKSGFLVIEIAHPSTTSTTRIRVDVIHESSIGKK
jgi:HSP20 family protein